MESILPTTVVGSYPQPNWLIDRAQLGARVPRIRAREIWRVPDPLLAEAQDNATRIAIRDMERAGIDIVSDGEMRRESYSNRFATALDGIDADNPGTTISRIGAVIAVPRVVGPIRRRRPVEVRDVEFLRANTDRAIKITLPGPFTLTQQAQDDYDKDEEELALAYAAAVNDEARDLKAAGADVIQLDEPWLQAWPDRAARYGIKAVNRALAGIPGPTVVHLCFGYAHSVKGQAEWILFSRAARRLHRRSDLDRGGSAQARLSVLRDLRAKTVLVGVLDLAIPKAETADEVACRIRAALKYVPPERLIPAPDCGMKYLPRDTAFAKLRALAQGTAVVRRELT